MSEICLKIEDLRVGFRTSGRVVPALDRVSLELRRGEMLALLGESGSGKSLTALALMGLLPRPAGVLMGGHAWFDGVDLFALPEEEKRKLRGGRIAMIFQEPMTALNPVLTIGQQLGECLELHQGLKGEALRQRAVELLEEVEIPEAAQRLDSYPHELSGGLRQRVMIAMAIAGEPDILIADEPTTALDVTVQAQIMRLLSNLQQRHGTAILFITHNLALAAQVADRGAVMYAGELVECAAMSELFRAPRHPYTRLLLGALPRSDIRGGNLANIAGMVPRNWSELTGCRFAGRCPLATAECTSVHPELTGGDHAYRCCRNEIVELTESTAGSKARSAGDTVLEVKDLRVWFPVRSGWFHRKVADLKAVDGVDLTLRAGETVALVGESGCGKSTFGKALIRLLDPAGGQICLASGEDVATAKGRGLAELRRQVQMIFQDPFSSLDPRLMVGESIAEGLALRFPKATRAEQDERVGALLSAVGLNPGDALRYPHQFSGGQRQRIGLARALAVEPKVIICDECTSALDVSVQAQILNLLRLIQGNTGVAYLFITHDLSVVGYLADRVAVMYLGHIVEEGPATELFAHPAHPYTAALVGAAPRLTTEASGVSAVAPGAALSGEVPSPVNPPAGCPFHPRCPHAVAECKKDFPSWVQVSPGHRCRCVMGHKLSRK